MIFEIIRDVQKIKNLKNEWDNLVVESVFQTHDWVYNWYKYLCVSEPYLIVARRNNKITGIAPLVRKKILGRRVLRFAGAPMSDYNAFIINDDSFVKELYFYLMKKNKCDIALFDDISESSETLLNFAKNKIKNSLSFFSNPCLALNLRSQKHFHKKSIRRHVKLLQNSGDINLLKINKEDYKTYFLILQEQHKKTWDKKIGKSIFMDKRISLFFQTILKNMNDNIDFWALTLNEKPIALQLGFLFNDRYITYIQSEDKKYMKNSPGSVLYMLFIEYYKKSGLSIVDFRRGAEEYKLRFSNMSRKNHGFLIAKTWFLYILLKMIFKTKGFVIERRKLHVLSIKFRQELRNAYKRLEESVEEI